MYGTWIAYWMAACVILSAVLIFATLRISRGRYWIAAICFATIALGTGFLVVFPMFFGINMASAFGPHSMSLLEYFYPIVIVVAFGYSALSLSPSMSCTLGRKIVSVVVGIAVCLSLYSFIEDAMRWPRSNPEDLMVALALMLYLLLWLRVHDIRLAVESMGKMNRQRSG